MSILEKYLDSLDIRFGKTYHLEILKPIYFHSIFEERNVIVQLNKGEMLAGEEKHKIQPNSFYFIPQGQPFTISLGKRQSAIKIEESILTNENERGEYFNNIEPGESVSHKKNVITVLSFEVILYNAFPFFSLLNVPPFEMTPDEEFSYLIKYLNLEDQQEKLGKKMIMENYMQDAVIHLCRYIEMLPNLRKHTKKLEFLNNKKLVDIFHYINTNLDKDLSNKNIAALAYVSEEYIGQFFKTITNRNLQEYIEDQRLAKAMYLLKSQPHNIQEIAHKVGFRDPTYFSRRFKMKYGVNANSVKQRKGQVV